MQLNLTGELSSYAPAICADVIISGWRATLVAKAASLAFQRFPATAGKGYSAQQAVTYAVSCTNSMAAG